MKKLPLGINTLSKLISQNCVYIDKTAIALRLIRQGGAFFISRPRRFGKSLFVDTLKEIFEGNKGLFEGLYIEDKWDWSKTYPVIKIDFASGTLQNRKELDDRIWQILRQNQKRLGVESSEKTDLPGYLEEIIINSFEKYGQRVVVLVDEYDKPILDNIDNPGIAVQMREGLKNLYSVFKGQDAHIQFVFMTGVSKFSKVSLFSGLNQFTDITLDEDFATICGYTQEDLQTGFSQHLLNVDVEKINPLTLLFQTGYLTIDKTFTRRQRMMFALKIPNLEVKIALSDQFINGYTDLVNEKIAYQDHLYDFMEQGDLAGMESVIKRLFAGIPYRNFTNNKLPEVEGYYASVLYAFFVSLDAEIIPEDVSSHGQVNMTVKLGWHIYVMEIKLIDESSIDHNPALEQIKNKGYAEKYQGQEGVTVHELGLVFSKAERNLVKCDWA